MEIVEDQRRKILSPGREQRGLLIAGGLVIGDLLALGVAFWLAYWLRFRLLPYEAYYKPLAYLRLMLVVLPAWILIFAALRMYQPQTLFGGLQEYAAAFNGVTLGTVGVMVLLFFGRQEALISRGWLALTWLLAALLVIAARFGERRAVYALRRKGVLLAPAVIVGANAEGCALAEQLRSWPTSGLHLAGFLDPDQPAGTVVCHGLRVVGGLDDLERMVKSRRVEEVIVAPTALSREQLLRLFSQVGVLPQAHLRLSSGLFEVMTTGLQVKELASVPLIEVNRWRYTGMDAFLKGLQDYGLTLIALLLGWPFLLAIGALVRLDSPGPVFYRRRVMGVNGQEFDAFKFRTMQVDGHRLLAERPDLQAELARTYKLKDDPRVTRVGRLLRKLSLDELPQLCNVLLGQMSLVGPRMISPPEMAEYGKWGMNLLTVKPGLTGLWQISGRSDVSYEERVRLDMHYIRNWSLWLDLYILLATVPAVLRKKGAY